MFIHSLTHSFRPGVLNGLEEGPGDGWRLYLHIFGVFLAPSLSFGQRYTYWMEKEMGSHSSILAWEIHGQRRVVGYSPWGGQES